MEKNRNKAVRIFLSGVESVLPDKMIYNTLTLEKDRLSIQGKNYLLDEIEHIYVLGAGKASALMGQAVEAIFGERISGGVIIVKYGHDCPLQRITVRQAGHPTPDEAGFNATKELVAIAAQAEEKDLVICLFSGGGSSLMADYPEGSCPEDISRLNALLLHSGADIHELNAVRKHLSRVKGGQLAKTIYPAKVISLMLSDVIGDPPDVIASGPTAPDSSTFQEAWNVIQKYDLSTRIPDSLKSYLLKGLGGKEPETPKIDDDVFNRVDNLIIGSNRLALQTAQRTAIELGYKTEIITSSLAGDVNEVCADLLSLIQSRKDEKSPLCILLGGEPTVKVTGSGLGGRNQHLALLLAQHISGFEKEICILVAGTDGTDGPTVAAGAVIDRETVCRGEKKGLTLQHYIDNFDAYHYFKIIDELLVTGSTKTNVMDMIVVLIG